MTSPLSLYGPGVLGKELFEQEQARLASLEHLYGPAVTGKKANVLNPAVVGESAQEPAEAPETAAKALVATKVAELPAALATVTDAAALARAAELDKRKGADALYAARLAELSA